MKESERDAPGGAQAQEAAAERRCVDVAIGRPRERGGVNWNTKLLPDSAVALLAQHGLELDGGALKNLCRY